MVGERFYHEKKMNFTYDYSQDELPTVLCEKCKQTEIKRSCTETCNHMVCINCVYCEIICPVCIEYMPAEIRRRILREHWEIPSDEDLSSGDEE